MDWGILNGNISEDLAKEYTYLGPRGESVEGKLIIINEYKGQSWIISGTMIECMHTFM